MQADRPICYSARCRACWTVLSATPEEMDFKGANSFRCPTCGNAVHFTDSLGFLLDGVEVVYMKGEEKT